MHLLLSADIFYSPSCQHFKGYFISLLIRVHDSVPDSVILHSKHLINPFLNFCLINSLNRFFFPENTCSIIIIILFISDHISCPHLYYLPESPILIVLFVLLSALMFAVVRICSNYHIFHRVSLYFHSMLLTTLFR